MNVRVEAQPQPRPKRDESEGNSAAGAEKFKDATGTLPMRPRLPFLRELSVPAKALASRFSSRTPVAMRQEMNSNRSAAAHCTACLADSRARGDALVAPARPRCWLNERDPR